jgi:hypothetical protein
VMLLAKLIIGITLVFVLTVLTFVLMRAVT